MLALVSVAAAHPLDEDLVPLSAALDAAGIAHHDLDFGSYFSDWRRRNALKMWTGWPTFPMVFVKGVLVGGADDLARLIEKGEVRAGAAK